MKYSAVPCRRRDAPGPRRSSRQDGRHGESVAGKADGRLREPFPGQTAPTPMRLLEEPRRPGHADGSPADHRRVEGERLVLASRKSSGLAAEGAVSRASIVVSRPLEASQWRRNARRRGRNAAARRGPARAGSRPSRRPRCRPSRGRRLRPARRAGSRPRSSRFCRGRALCRRMGSSASALEEDSAARRRTPSKGEAGAPYMPAPSRSGTGQATASEGQPNLGVKSRTGRASARYSRYQSMKAFTPVSTVVSGT